MIQTEDESEASINHEEINRVCSDHVSLLLLASTQKSLDNWVKENLNIKAKFVGNLMLDAFWRWTFCRWDFERNRIILAVNILNNYFRELS